MAAISALLSQIVVNGGTATGTGAESKSDLSYFSTPPNPDTVSLIGIAPATAVSTSAVYAQVAATVPIMEKRWGYRARAEASTVPVPAPPGVFLPALLLAGHIWEQKRT